MNQADRVLRFLDLLASADLKAWGELWHPDGVMISMFDIGSSEDANEQPQRHVGREAVVAYFEGALPLFGPFTFDEVVVHPTTGNIAIAEWHSSAQVTATGATYENRFIGVFDYGLSGFIEEYRQYRDPNAFARVADSPG